MIRSLLGQCRLVLLMAMGAGLLCAAPAANAGKHPIEVYLVNTGQTIAVPVGQELIVSLPILHYNDDYWYVAENTGGELKLIGQPVERRPRNWTPWGYSRQEFHFRRESAGPSHMVFERSYFSKPLVLEVVDPKSSH